MKLISTSGGPDTATFQEALMQGPARDGGLYLPASFPSFSPEFLDTLPSKSFTQIAFDIACILLEGEIPDSDLDAIIQDSMSFPVPLHILNPGLGVLELFHGPTFAFKDFGARFMARSVEYFQRESNVELTVLVATSGDTGSAVAQGFTGTEGIRVILLYPQGRVSRTQELQITSVGGSVTALEIDGTFDDCQRLVKAAFADRDLQARQRLTSANSINIARLLPQSFYYFEAFSRSPSPHLPLIFYVPSGNLGNLTGGLIAWKLGLPVDYFIAATNANRVLVDYLDSGVFTPVPATSTLSNAMDVGNPSNLARIRMLFCSDHSAMRTMIRSTSISDGATRETIAQVYAETGYMLDPHAAVAYAALLKTRDGKDGFGVVLGTAHPAKFPEAYDEPLRSAINIPSRLQDVLRREKKSVLLSNRFEDFKEFLLNS